MKQYVYIVTNQKSLYSNFKTATVQNSLDYFKDQNIIGVDTETTGLDCHIDKILSLQLEIGRASCRERV